MKLPAASPDNYYHFNSSLKELARELRKHPTQAEQKLWHEVLNRSRLGVRFIRQRPVLNYIADFMCKQLLIIIEVDGYTHHFEEVWKNDVRRQKELEEVGFWVIRFPDERVLNQLEEVRWELEQVIGHRRDELLKKK